MKQTQEKLKKLFIPGQHNNFKPSFFESKNSFIFSILIFGLFIFAMNIQTILFGLANHSKLAAILSTTLIQLTNEERVKVALNTLQENELLNQAALLKAQDMATKGYFAHTSPEGKKPHNWLQDVGYKYQYAGENLAVNFANSEDVTVAWMNSPTHKANIVKPVYTEIGIGVAKGKFEGRDTIFVAQVFASPYTGVTANIGDSLGQMSGPVYDFFEYIFNNNHDIINKILIGILALIILALVLKVAIHIRIQHGKLIVNAMLLIAFICTLILVNNFIDSQKTPMLEYSSYEYENTQE